MSTTAKILGTITYGEVIAVERIETPAGGLPWARLAEPERCGLQGNLSSVSIFPPDEAFVLIDGTALGLGPLLQEVVDTASAASNRVGLSAPPIHCVHQCERREDVPRRPPRACPLLAPIGLHCRGGATVKIRAGGEATFGEPLPDDDRRSE